MIASDLRKKGMYDKVVEKETVRFNVENENKGSHSHINLL